MSNSEEDWIEKYRAAVTASTRTKESRFRRVMKAIAEARRKLRNLAGLATPARALPSQVSPPTKITARKKSFSPSERKKKAS